MCVAYSFICKMWQRSFLTSSIVVFCFNKFLHVYMRASIVLWFILTDNNNSIEEIVIMPLIPASNRVNFCIRRDESTLLYRMSALMWKTPT